MLNIIENSSTGTVGKLRVTKRKQIILSCRYNSHYPRTVWYSTFRFRTSFWPMIQSRERKYYGNKCLSYLIFKKIPLEYSVMKYWNFYKTES